MDLRRLQWVRPLSYFFACPEYYSSDDARTATPSDLRRGGFRLAEALTVLALSMVVAVIRCGPILKDGYVGAHPGDAFGAIGDFYDFGRLFLEQGVGFVAGDSYTTDWYAGGVNGPSASSSFWKLVIAVCTLLSDAPGAYDAVLVMAQVAITFFGYVMVREAGASRFMAAVAAIALGNLQNFYYRSIGHLNLATYFSPIVLVWAILRVTRAPTSVNMAILAATMAVNFQVNEYYGFHGTFVVALTLALTGVGTLKWARVPARPVIARYLGGGLVFGALMLALYPNLIGHALFGGDAPIADVARRQWDVNLAAHFSMPGPWGEFKPGLPWLDKVAPRKIREARWGDEFTFRVGYWVLAVSFYGTLAAVAFAAFRKRALTLPRCFWRSLTVLWVVVGIAICLSLQPRYKMSLVPLTNAIGPMFRVTVRSLIYSDIAIIALFALILSRLIQSAVTLARSRRAAALAGGFAFLFAVASAVTLVSEFHERFEPFKPVAAFQLPDRPDLRQLGDLSFGYVYNMPYFIEPTKAPEHNYEYKLQRMFHHKPIANGAHFAGHGAANDRALGLDDTNINRISDRLVRNLQRSGIRYIVVHKQRVPDPTHPQLANYPALEQVIESPEIVVYAFREPVAFSRDIFRRDVLTW